MNATPLIDVLLVLLVMLIFTLPVATHAVKLNLPQATPAPPSAVVSVYVEFDGQLSWNGESVSDLDALGGRLRAAAAAASQPRVHGAG
jgi:biopolymer transport protein ExbD